MKSKAARGRAKKHATARKHTTTAKHHPASKKSRATARKPSTTAVAKHPTHAKARAWSLGDVSLCAPAAVARSLVLAGGSVSPQDVLALYWRVADTPDAGASIWATLEAACRWGLGGVRPVSFAPVGADDPAAVILGVDLPGSHAVVADGGHWWNWGTVWPPSAFPDAVIEEAWAIEWGKEVMSVASH